MNFVYSKCFSIVTHFSSTMIHTVNSDMIDEYMKYLYIVFVVISENILEENLDNIKHFCKLK